MKHNLFLMVVFTTFIIGLLLFVACSDDMDDVKIDHGQVPESQNYAAITLSRYCDFHLEGTVCDDQCNPLHDVQIMITESRLDHEKLTVDHKKQKHMIDGKFVIDARDVAALTLIFSKEGFYNQSVMFKLNDAFEKRNREWKQTPGNVSFNALSMKERADIFRNLNYEDNRIIVEMKKLEGDPIEWNSKRFNINLDGDHLSENVWLTNDHSREPDFRVEIRQHKNTLKYGLFLVLPENSGIIVTNYQGMNHLKSVFEIPQKGYSQEIELIPSKFNSIPLEFFMKSNQRAVKGYMGFHIDSDSPEGLLSIHHRAIQEDGSRKIVTRSHPFQ